MEDNIVVSDSPIGIAKDSDYAYIEIFIQFLREIVAIIKDLFSGLDLSKLTGGNNETEGE